MIKGLDNGYMYTKDNSRHVFRSAYTLLDVAMNGSQKIQIDSKTYYCGVGEGVVDVNKIDSQLNKVCTLADLSQENATDFYLGVGLPISQFSKYKDTFKQKILSYNSSKVIYKGIEKHIKIKDVVVFPQGVASLYSEDIVSDCILVDIGGLTIDVAFIEYRDRKPYVAKCDTWYKGMLTLFSRVIEAINLRFEMEEKPYRAEKYLRDGLKIYGEKQDLSFIQDIYLEYITPILNEVKMNYPSKTVPVILVGGGAELLFHTFQKTFKDCRVHHEGQFANALGLYKVALSKFSKYER